MQPNTQTTQKSHTPPSDPRIEALMARIKELEAGQKPAKMGMKVSSKGALSVYGLGRFPVTLYASQWDALLQKCEDIKKFMEENKANLKAKE